MAKKNRIKKLFEHSTIEPADTQPRSRESVPAEQSGEVISPVTSPQDEAMGASIGDEGSADEKSPLSDEGTPEITESDSADLHNEATLSEPNPEEEDVKATGEFEASLDSEKAEELASEDVLDDVRRSLIEEEESDKNRKESKWWRRIGRKEKKPEPEAAPVPDEIDLPATAGLAEVVETHEQKEEAEAEIDEIEDLINLLEAETKVSAVESAVAPDVEMAAEAEPEIDFEELKRQAFQPRTGDEEPENSSDVRSIVLEGGEEVLVEVEAKPVNPMEERLSAYENALKPYKRYVYTALALLGVGMAIFASLILFNIYKQSRPQPVKEVSNLPYPTAVSLPGGWSFQLGQGTLQAGRWDPSGPEWLEGTEVCRWVALPWSRQLEAVVRTLNPKDPVELVMSNNDKLTYEVYSIRELTMEEIQALDSNSPCLLLILTQSDSDSHWVLTALP